MFLNSIKDDPNFISECNAGTLELMKEAQEAAASAAQSSAFSQQMALMSNQTPNIMFMRCQIKIRLQVPVFRPKFLYNYNKRFLDV